jgi:tetratricopeptide (TPR) repeat protein
MLHRCLLHRRLLAATLTLALAAPSLAYADGPSPEVTQQARSHYKQGKAYQEAGAYDKAIAEYLEADRLLPRPEMFFNIAQCHRLAGHKQAAVDYYRRFVAALPNAAGADEARMYIAQLDKQLDAERAEQAERERAQSKSKAKSKPQTPPAPQLVEKPAPTARPSAHSGHPQLRWVGVGSAAVGVALIGTGAYLGLQAASESDELSGAHAWTSDYDARENAAKDDERNMILLVSGGSLLVVGGAALFWWAGRPAGLEAAPSVGKDRAGIVVRGTF